MYFIVVYYKSVSHLLQNRMSNGFFTQKQFQKKHVINMVSGVLTSG